MIKDSLKSALVAPSPLLFQFADGTESISRTSNRFKKDIHSSLPLKIESLSSYLDFHGLGFRLLQCVNQIYVVHRTSF